MKCGRVTKCQYYTLRGSTNYHIGLHRTTSGDIVPHLTVFQPIGSYNKLWLIITLGDTFRENSRNATNITDCHT